MKISKSDYIAIGFGIILLVVIFGIAYTFTSNKPSPIQEEMPAPTSIPQRRITQSVQQSSSGVSYDAQAEEQFVDKLTNKQPLSQADAEAKDAILQNALGGYNSGVAYETENVRLEYIKSVDMFMAEVKTIDIAKAKAEVNVWFINQGLSQQGICDLPLRFLPAGEIQQQLIELNITFNELPNSC